MLLHYTATYTVKAIMFRLVLAFTVILTSYGSNGFSYQDCGSNISIATMDNFEISPAPIIIPGAIEMTVAYNIKEDVPEDAEIKIEIFKRVKVFGTDINLRLPCANGVGSCVYTPCTLLEELGERLCPMFPEGRECSCPIKAGLYGANKRKIQLPEISDAFKTFARGNYFATMKLISATEEELACFRVDAQIDVVPDATTENSLL